MRTTSTSCVSRRATTLFAVAAVSVSLAAGLSHVATAAPSEGGGPVLDVNLSAVDDDDVNVRFSAGELSLLSTVPRTTAQPAADGSLVAAAQVLATPANRIRVDLSAKVPAGTNASVDVRGDLGGLRWTEWTPAVDGVAMLPQSVTTIQSRITLETRENGAAPSVTALRLTAENIPQTFADAAAAPLTYRVYATREGLPGGTTANGHVITARDHFVALPSRRGLAPKNTGTYSVRVCTTTGSRCEYAPVWDVGPWNTMDDYWNPASIRQMWKDLPQGKPEAQAAYLDGYNGGKDEFGRRVANPAGIDLADGVFWDGLGLSDNSWVNVTYLWSGTGRTGVVRTAGDPMNIRSAPSTTATIRGLAANYANVPLECYVRGATVTGTYGTTDIWNRIGPNHYISDAYVYTGSDEPVVAAC